jgi:site-specific DNA recombinase
MCLIGIVTRPARLGASAPPAIEAVALHPATLARYEEQLTRLQAALANGIRADDSESSEAIGDLVETVTVFRDNARAGGVQVEIAGRLTALLGEQAYPNQVRGVRGKMVAEVRYTSIPTIENALFCYWREAA